MSSKKDEIVIAPFKSFNNVTYSISADERTDAHTLIYRIHRMDKDSLGNDAWVQVACLMSDRERIRSSNYAEESSIAECLHEIITQLNKFRLEKRKGERVDNDTSHES